MHEHKLMYVGSHSTTRPLRHDNLPELTRHVTQPLLLHLLVTHR